jgi:site-specific recombinase XerD
LQLERFAHHFDSTGRPPESLNVNDCESWVQSLQDRTGQSNVNQCLTAISGFLTYLVKDGRLPMDSLHLWQLYHKSQYMPVRCLGTSLKFLRPEVVTALFDTAAGRPNQRQAHRDVAFLATIFLCVERPETVSQLRMRHVLYRAEPGFSKLVFSFPGEIRKTHRPTDCEINEHLAQPTAHFDAWPHLFAYDQWRREQMPADPDSPYFVGVCPLRIVPPSMSTWHSNFATIARKAGHPHTTLYFLRHTAGELAKQSMPISDVAQLFDHGDTRTTERYTRHNNADRRRELLHKFATDLSNFGG